MISGLLYGQQDPHYTQYMYNQNVLNPAYAGSGSDLSIGLLGRTQWVGIDGAPDTQTLTLHSNLGKDSGLGVGLSLINDQIGPARETNASLDVSYALPVSDMGRLSFGLKGSYNMLNVDLNGGVLTNDQGDALFTEDVDDKSPNIGAGLYYHNERFYAGLAVPSILENHTYTIVQGNDIQDVSDKMHWFGTLGYVFDLSESVKFKPSAMVKMVTGSPISLDLNGSLYINDKFEVGLSFREGDSIDGILGLQATESLRIGYAYDHTLTNLGDYNSGSHELMLLFDLSFAKKHIKSPRYF